MSVLTERDRALVHAAWSLGLATHETLRLLVSPKTRANTLRRRLRLLHVHGYLTQTRHIGPGRCIWLYGVGPRSLVLGESRPWRPSLAQLEHTLAVGDVLVSLVQPRPGIAITGWKGEAELRAWAAPGAPYPDAQVSWRVEDVSGTWLIEVDRGTESRSAWSRKLARYLVADIRQPILAVTLTRRRAARLAAIGAELGVDVFGVAISDLDLTLQPRVFDASRGLLTSLREVALHQVEGRYSSRRGMRGSDVVPQPIVSGRAV